MTELNIYPFSVLPLRDIVVYPDMVAPLFVGREKSIHALEQVLENNDERHILLLTQKESESETPTVDELYHTGVVARVLQMLRLPDGSVKVLVEGKARAKALHVTEGDYCFEAVAEVLFDADIESMDTKTEALMRSVKEAFVEYSKLERKISQELVANIQKMDDPYKLADLVAMHVSCRIENKQKLLEVTGYKERLEFILEVMEGEMGILNTKKKIHTRVKDQMERNQKEYYLNEQMKAIQKELHDNGDGDEISLLEDKVKKAKMTREASEKAIGELKKMRMMNPMSSEATVIRNYVDWLLDVPWKKRSKVKHDIVESEEILDKDHYGLEKVKERVLEYLAVQQRTKSLKGPILCLVGPPGVGKTSLARSIAEATGRKYTRMSLGGVRDEAEIRGHRRTYIGAQPGKIMQLMKKVGTSNPLFLLDEIDKMGVDFRGDPASALLEVLDPEQNKNFNDHYFEVDYDLSDVLFVATANSLDLPRPLLDRMEIIRLSGYTEDEKVEIAKRHLIPKIRKEHGLKKAEWEVKEAVVRDVVRYYTREAGVRNLERELAKLARKALKDILTDKDITKVDITKSIMNKYLGVKRFNYGEIEEENRVGVVTGLAYTEVGGDLLQIESVAMPSGKGKMTITGKLGEVMQESVQAAASYVRARSLDFGIIPPDILKKDIHIHVPEGATPKDGPSAGIAMCTSIVSLLSGIPIKRDVAMTGEITLRGRVLPIGGLKEKLLAALRGGIKTVIIPQENKKDLAEIPDKVKKGLKIIPVSTVDEVLGIALEEPLVPVEWTEADIAPDLQSAENDGNLDKIIKH